MKEYNSKNYKKLGWLLFITYMIILFYLLFFSEAFNRDLLLDNYQYNLEPFKEIRLFFDYREQLGMKSFLVNIFGNILAFAPFGFLLPHLLKRYRRFFSIVFLSIFFSLAIELTQMLTKVGRFDVDDIILNTFGGILGYLIYTICRGINYLLHPKRKDKKRKIVSKK